MRAFLAGVLVALTLGSSASAQRGHEADWASLRFARVGADDVAKTVSFFKAAFHMQEVLRIERPGSQEVFLNFGATLDEAKAATTPQILITTRPEGAGEPKVSNLVLAVGNLAAVLKRAAEAGGSIERAPVKSPTTGSTIAIVREPSGNRIELIMAANSP